MCARTLLGGVQRALEIYRRVDRATDDYPWSVPTTEDKWHCHAEGVLMVALRTKNLPPEAWQSPKLLRATPQSTCLDDCIPFHESTVLQGLAIISSRQIIPSSDVEREKRKKPTAPRPTNLQKNSTHLANTATSLQTHGTPGMAPRGQLHLHNHRCSRSLKLRQCKSNQLRPDHLLNRRPA